MRCRLPLQREARTPSCLMLLQIPGGIPPGRKAGPPSQPIPGDTNTDAGL